MGIEGVSGGHMARLQSLQAKHPAQDLQRLQEAGSELDQKVRQLDELIKKAIAGGANPEALRALQAQLAQLQQAPVQSADDSQAIAASGSGGQGGTSGAAALELAKKLDDIKKQIETIAQAAGMEASGFSQQSQQQAQQQLNAFGQDQNLARGRDMKAMY